jgi:hypothetical protein
MIEMITIIEMNDQSSGEHSRCIECKMELSPDARYCPSCGTQVGIKKDVFDVSSDGLVGKVKELFQDAQVKRVVIKDGKGKTLLSIPVTWGAAGTLAVVAFAPWLAAIGVVAGLVTKCTVEVERLSKN